MNTERNILIAFILNLAFSIFEFFGGIITGSVAIISDSIHDFGDALSIGLSFFLEKKSKRKPDEEYTYGYFRYSVLGGLITSLILLIGSIFVIVNAVSHIIRPSTINYDGMIIFTIVGVVINFVAARVTHGGDSLNQKAVNLHMMEDVMGWVVVLIGAIVMKYSNFFLLDPIMSICVSVYILMNAMKNLGEVLELFLEKTPRGVDIGKIKEELMKIDRIKDVHHIHVWSMDRTHNYATLHVVASQNNELLWELKDEVRGKMREYGVNHVTIEIETEDEMCKDRYCMVDTEKCSHRCCHQHHHSKLKNTIVFEN